MMKRRLLCFCLAVVMLCLHTQAVFVTAEDNASKETTQTVRASDLSDPIRERILDGDSGYSGSFAFLNENGLREVGKISDSVLQLLVSNSQPNVQPPKKTPSMEEQNRDLAYWEEQGNVFKVSFDTQNGAIAVEPSGKWLVICAEGYADATYGVLPEPVGPSEFLGWFTAPKGGEKIEADSLTTSPVVRTLYAHWNEVAFADVRENSAFYAPVYWAVQNGITKGTSVAQFSPNAQCTRKQILMFLWRAATQPADANANDFDAALEWAYQQGILSKGDANFDAKAPCTRSEAMTYLWKQCGQSQLGAGEAQAALSGFQDISADDAYAPAVAWAIRNGITNGTSETTFSPDSVCTRGQIVAFLYRACAKGLLKLG